LSGKGPMKLRSCPAPTLKVDHANLHRELSELCRRALETIIIDPGVQVVDVSVDSTASLRFDSSVEKLLITVRVQTNDSSMLRGDPDSYRGSYKERVEGILDFHAKKILTNSEVYLQIDGPAPPSVQRLIPVVEFLESARLSDTSPIVKTAQSYSIPYILIRGRHYIAPSPAMAQYLAEFLHRSGPRAKRVLDLFGGTGLAAKIMCSLGRPDRVVVVEKDADALRKMREHVLDRRVEMILGDAFAYQINEPFDVVIADPYYEDVIRLLNEKLNSILARTDVLVLVPGNVGDVIWNSEVERVLASSGVHIKKFAAYGQAIFEVTH